jgi:hypothetical protein
MDSPSPTYVMTSKAMPCLVELSADSSGLAVLTSTAKLVMWVHSHTTSDAVRLRMRQPEPSHAHAVVFQKTQDGVMFAVMSKGVRMVKLNASGRVVPSRIDDALTVSTGDTQGAGE